MPSSNPRILFISCAMGLLLNPVAQAMYVFPRAVLGDCSARFSGSQRLIDRITLMTPVEWDLQNLRFMDARTYRRNRTTTVWWNFQGVNPLVARFDRGRLSDRDLTNIQQIFFSDESLAQAAQLTDEEIALVLAWVKEARRSTNQVPRVNWVKRNLDVVTSVAKRKYLLELIGTVQAINEQGGISFAELKQAINRYYLAPSPDAQSPYGGYDASFMFNAIKPFVSEIDRSLLSDTVPIEFFGSLLGGHADPARSDVDLAVPLDLVPIYTPESQRAIDMLLRELFFDEVQRQDANLSPSQFGRQMFVIRPYPLHRIYENEIRPPVIVQNHDLWGFANPIIVLVYRNRFEVRIYDAQSRDRNSTLVTVSYPIEVLLEN